MALVALSLGGMMRFGPGKGTGSGAFTRPRGDHLLAAPRRRAVSLLGALATSGTAPRPSPSRMPTATSTCGSTRTGTPALHETTPERRRRRRRATLRRARAPSRRGRCHPLWRSASATLAAASRPRARRPTLGLEPRRLEMASAAMTFADDPATAGPTPSTPATPAAAPSPAPPVTSRRCAARRRRLAPPPAT